MMGMIKKKTQGFPGGPSSRETMSAQGRLQFLNPKQYW